MDAALLLLCGALFSAGCADPMGKALDADKAGQLDVAARWYSKAAEAGNKEAQYQLGERYRAGKGVARNLEQAKQWYLKAAEQGHPGAQAYSGLLRLGLEGATIDLDYPEAFRWLSPAATEGNAIAQVGLAYMYEIGTSVTSQNYNEAVILLTKAADQGNTVAKTHLPWLVREGVGTPDDKAETLKYLLGASIGNVNAMRALGYMYQQGRGIPQDRIAAHRWLQAALEAGDDISRGALNRLQTEMTIEQIQEAQKQSVPGN